MSRLASKSVFPERLRFMRKRNHLTQEKLAKMIHLSRKSISHYECGEREPELGGFCELVNALDCPADFLIGRMNMKELNDYYTARYRAEHALRLAEEQVNKDTDDKDITY